MARNTGKFQRNKISLEITVSCGRRGGGIINEGRRGGGVGTVMASPY